MKKILVIFSICLVISCNKNKKTEVDMSNNEEDIPIMGNQALFLTEEELKIYSQKALEGDNEAAIKVSNHYSFIEFNHEEGTKWMELAAKNGDITAMHNTAINYSVINPPQYDKALFWAEKYKELSLEETDKFIQDCLMCLTKGRDKGNFCQQEEYKGNSPLFTSEEQIEQQKQQVLRKNYTAALALFYHYTSINNNKEAEKWLVLAAKNGLTHAKQDLACVYYNQNRFKEALYWAEQFKESQEQEADRLINRFKSKLNKG